MSKNRRVLVVDDNPFNLGILDEMLAGDYQLTFASSGSEALRVAPRLRPLAILLDVMMPGLDGLETCRRLRTTAELRDVPIIMTTAKAMPSERAAGYNAGADHYMAKPFDECDLLRLLRRYEQGGAGCGHEGVGASERG